MVLSESSYCAACNSFFHAPDTCPKTLPTYQPVSNVLVEHGPQTGAIDLQAQVLPTLNAGLALELQLRSILAGGIGTEGRRCAKHRRMQLQILSKAPSGRHASVPIVLDGFDDSCFVTRRSLLPICSTCVQAETGLEETALPQGLDICRCATMLARAACPNCVLWEIRAGLKYELLTRTKPSEDGSCEVACGCGKAITAEKMARQCAYCRGIVTTPFCAYGGEVLQFKDGVDPQTMSGEEGKTEVKTE